MAYKLGRRSLDELAGVAPILVETVQVAITVTAVDFGVLDGVRTTEEQADLMAQGRSWTMDSRHLPQADGLGWAVDLVPWIRGAFRWEWSPIFEVAAAMRRAAIQTGARIRWGGPWCSLEEIGDPARAVYEYVGQRVIENRDHHADGPHFELIGI